MKLRAVLTLTVVSFLVVHLLGAQPVSLRYFYDDDNELFRVLDSTGTLIEYIYDPSGNIAQVNRSTVTPSALAILNIVPLNGSGGQTVTIYGQNFSPSAAGDVVKFNGIAATVISASSTVLVVQAPGGVTSGQVTVTANGVTVSSGNLTFGPPSVPAITSITPSYGSVGQTLTGVVIQGSNLAGVSFDLQGGGVVTPVAASSTQATVNIAIGQAPGVYVMIASGSAGMSSSQAASGNTFVVYNTAGNNYADMLFSVFNATGPTPNYPAGSNEAELQFSVFNATGPRPNYPAGSNVADLLFSVFNPTGPAPNFPAGSNEADLLFSVFNPLSPPGTKPLIPAGSNEAFQLFSTKNLTGTPPAAIGISVLQPAGRLTLGSDAPGNASSNRAGSGQSLTLIAGQTVQITLRPSLFMSYLEVDADGAPLASSTTGSLSLPITAPFGVDSIGLSALGYSSFASASDSTTQPVRIVADHGRTITGRVIDAQAAPVAGALVTWQAEGMATEYYRFGQELSALPDLTGMLPARVSFLGALNYPNPRGVFGLDPMGVGLGRHYAVRLLGKIQVDTAGTYQFALRAHAGARLRIDGQLVAEAASSGADSTLAMGSAGLTAGVHEIEVLHFESGGTAALQLLWTPPGGVEAVVPPRAITAEAPAQWRVVTQSDGRFVLQAPAALDGVAVKLVAGVGSVQVDQ